MDLDRHFVTPRQIAAALVDVFASYAKAREFIINELREARREGWTDRIEKYEQAERELNDLEAREDKMIENMIIPITTS